jgi:hypothetical protein
MTVSDRNERFVETNHLGVATMRYRRHPVHHLVFFAVLSGSMGLTVAAAAPASAASPNDFLCYVAGSSQVAAVGAAYANPLQVELSSTACTSPTPDIAAGPTVSYSVVTTAGGPSVTFSPSSVVTPSNAMATVMVSANGVAGAFTVVATSSATASNPTSQSVTLSLTNAGPGPANITAGIGDFQSTSVGTTFTLGLAVTVDDASNNPVANAPVTFLAPTVGASGTFSTTDLYAVTVLTDAEGIAVAPAFTANETPGGYVVKASVAGYAPSAAFALVNEAVTSLTAISASPSSLNQGATGQNVTITGSDFLSGATVTFSNSAISVNSTTLLSSTSLEANVTIKSDAKTGPVSVTVVDPGGSTATGTDVFNVDSALAAARPAAFSLGFANNSAVVSAGDESRLRAYAHRLANRATIRFVGYANNVSLAKNRASNVARFLKSLVGTFHLSFVEVTSSSTNAVRVTTVLN